MQNRLIAVAGALKTNPQNSIELLEARIAPAAVFSYTDIDGDKVKITSSVGTDTDLMNAAQPHIVGGQLQLLDLSGSVFNGASIMLTVTRAGGGDGVAAVGHITGGTNNFKKIAIKGDLGDIDCGSDTPGQVAIASLSVRSMGRHGLSTQGGAGDLESDILGALGALSVSGDVKEAFINVTGATAAIGPVTIGGSVIGVGSIPMGPPTHSGEIFSSGAMGAVKIGHDVQGGSAANSGYIHCNGKMASLTIGGSVIGGNGFHSGEILSKGDLGAVKIGHDVQGYITGNGKIASVTIGGSLSGGVSSSGDLGAVKIGHDVQGGISSNSKIASVTIGGSLIGGLVSSKGDLGAVKIGGDLRGGNGGDRSGFIGSNNRIASVTIGGSIIAGYDDSPGGFFLLTNNASIRALGNIGSLTVKGSVTGSVGQLGAVTTVVISAQGTATTDLAIGKISIGGRVEHAQILAGYKSGGLPGGSLPTNGNAQIGAVSVGGDWIASDLIAGVQDGGTAGFGDVGDTIIGAGASIAKIASIVIKGIVQGSAASGDQFGFMSHAIGSLKINGATVPLASPVALSSLTGNDVTVRLV